MRAQLDANPSGRAPKRTRVNARHAPGRATTRAEPSSLVAYVHPEVERQVACLARDAQVDCAQIGRWLANMCLDLAGQAERAEKAACKQLVLASCLNAMLTTQGGREAVRTLLERPIWNKQDKVVQYLLEQFPIQQDWGISDRDWKIIHKKSQGYNLLALAAPQLDLKNRGYATASILRVAKSSKCATLVALCMPASGAPLIFDSETRLRILACDTGQRSLEAATNYMNALNHERDTLAAAGYGAPEIAAVLAPVSLTQDELVSIVADSGGLKRLAMAAEQLKPLVEQRVASCVNKQYETAMAQPQGALTKHQLVRILSHRGGAKSLAAVKIYQEWLVPWRQRLQASTCPASQLNKVLAPLTLLPEELVRLAGHRSGTRSLSVFVDHTRPLIEARVALCEQGQWQKALDQSTGELSKEQILQILAIRSCGENLAAALDYIASLTVPRVFLEFAHGSPDERARLLAPVTLSQHEMLRILAKEGGTNSLALATRYLKPLLDERVALCMQGRAGEVNTLFPGHLDKQQLVRILSQDGAAPSLTLALEYLDAVTYERAMLELAGYSPDRIEQALAPVTLNRDDVDRLHLRGSALARVKAAISYLKPQFEQRLDFCRKGEFEEAIDHPQGVWTKDQLTSILSFKGGADCLAAADRYLDELQVQRARLHGRAAPGQINQLLAPVSFSKNDLVAMLAYDCGLKRLRAGIGSLQPLREQRLALCEQGKFEEALVQSAGAVSKAQLVDYLSGQNGVALLAQRLAAMAARQQALPSHSAPQNISTDNTPRRVPPEQPADVSELDNIFMEGNGTLLDDLMPDVAH